MNEAPQQDLIDLGDAKQETKGVPDAPAFEEHPILKRREEG